MDDDKIAKLLLVGFNCNNCDNTEIDYDNGDVKCTIEDVWMYPYELATHVCKKHTGLNKETRCQK